MDLDLIHPEAKFPLQATKGSVGYDVFSVEKKTLPPLTTACIETGLRIKHMDKNIFAQLMSRSGLTKHNHCITCAGTIDSDYRGNISILLANLSPTEPVNIDVGDRISQLVFLPIIHLPSQTLRKENQIRGRGNFGSTGK